MSTFEQCPITMRDYLDQVLCRKFWWRVDEVTCMFTDLTFSLAQSTWIKAFLPTTPRLLHLQKWMAACTKWYFALMWLFLHHVRFIFQPNQFLMGGCRLECGPLWNILRPSSLAPGPSLSRNGRCLFSSYKGVGLNLFIEILVCHKPRRWLNIYAIPGPLALYKH